MTILQLNSNEPERVVVVPAEATNLEMVTDPDTGKIALVEYTIDGDKFWDNGISGPQPSARQILERIFAARSATLTDPIDYLYN